MKFFNRVRVATATLGQGTVTFGAVVSANFLSPIEAGAVDGDETTFVIEEGADFEISRGIVGGSGTTITRATVLMSKINGVSGTAKMELAGTAEVRFIQAAEDINSLVASAFYMQKLPEKVVTDNYTLTTADAGQMVVFNKATEISGLLPAVAASARQVYFVRCLGAGTLTIDRAGSDTIEGATSLVLPTGYSALIWPNDTASAWRAAVFFPFGSALLPKANDGAALGSATQSWSDLFLASGGVISFASNDVRIVHADNLLSFLNASNGYRFDGLVSPSANDNAALGAATISWSDLFLALGGVINWANGDVTATHSANTLAFAGAANGYSFDNLVDISGSSAGQIKFPAAQNASSNANTLDDYEEGTWTPVLTFATPGNVSVGYTQQQGTYTKVGNLCSLGLNIVTSSFTHTTAAGVAQITGVPFSSIATTDYFSVGAVQWRGITKTNFTDVCLLLSSNSSSLGIGISGSGQVATSVTVPDMPTAGTVVFRGGITYHTAS